MSQPYARVRVPFNYSESCQLEVNNRLVYIAGLPFSSSKEHVEDWANLLNEAFEAGQKSVNSRLT